MPAALTANQNFAGLMVDQSIVDKYLERVDRFVNNVNSFKETLDNLLARPEPAMPKVETPMYQAPAAAAAPVQNVVTADDINIDDLLSGIDLGGMSL